MKVLMSIFFLITTVFGNYVYQNNNSGKIDMHGGKGDSLINDKSSFSNSNFNSFQNGLGLKNYDSVKSESKSISKKKQKEIKK